MEKTKINIAFLETWTESESGWGQRDDGCSLHISKEDYEKYVEDYWADMPKEVPHEYVRPDSNLKEVVISDKLFRKLKKSKHNGIRLWKSEFRDLKDKSEILFKD